MRLGTHAQVLRRALARACEEHGAPNSFSFGELHTLHGGPDPRVAGRAIEFVTTVDTSLGRIEVESVKAGRVHVVLPPPRPPR